jgi:hypothetical protein
MFTSTRFVCARSKTGRIEPIMSISRQRRVRTHMPVGNVHRVTSNQTSEKLARDGSSVTRAIPAVSDFVSSYAVVTRVHKILTQRTDICVCTVTVQKYVTIVLRNIAGKP